jgi:hypothetical protein
MLPIPNGRLKHTLPPLTVTSMHAAWMLTSETCAVVRSKVLTSAVAT